MTVLTPWVAWGALGALVGVAYFATLGLNVRLYTGPHPGWAAVATHGARLVIAAVCFAAIARDAGAAALLAAFAGFLAVRTAAVHHVLKDAQAII
jgi:F1F0 ATPase subunit 2